MNSTQKTGYPSIDKPWLKYYKDGAYERALDIPQGKTLWDVLEEKMIEDAEVPLLEYFGRKISRMEFIQLARAWAKAFKAMGVGVGEIVPIYAPFFPDICAIACALDMIGAKTYFLKLSISEKALQEETAESKIAVVYDGMWENVKSVFMEKRFKRIIVVSAADDMPYPQKAFVKMKSLVDKTGKNSKIPKGKRFIKASKARTLGEHFTGKCKARFQKNRVSFITSSSGTSVNGIVKGTMATNEAAIYQLYKANEAEVNYHRGKRCLANLPPTASTSLMCLFFLPAYRGMTIIIDPRLSEEKCYEQIMSYKPQAAIMTGCFWESFFRKLEESVLSGKSVDLSFFDMPIVGGEGVTPESLEWMNRLLKRYGSKVPLFNGYGMSETFSVISVDKLGAEHEHKSELPVIGVGIPYPGIEAGIFNETGEELPYNERGELWVKDPSIMQGYYGKKDLTEKTVIDGWLHTGDIAQIDEDGYLYIWGRKNNSIFVDSETEVYLFDIENKIREDRSVKEAMVNAMPLADGAVSLVAHLLLENDSESIEKIIGSVDELLEDFLPKEMVIDGYKEHKFSFPISPTTAKKDRNGLMKDLRGYIKILGGVKYDVHFKETPDGYVKVNTLHPDGKS